MIQVRRRQERRASIAVRLSTTISWCGEVLIGLISFAEEDPVVGRSFPQVERLRPRGRICDQAPVGQDIHSDSGEEELAALDALAHESGCFGYRLGRGIGDAVPEFESFEPARPECPVRDNGCRPGCRPAAAVRTVQPIPEPAGEVLLVDRGDADRADRSAVEVERRRRGGRAFPQPWR